MMHFPTIPVVIVAALAKNTRAIGRNNELLWHIPDDLKRFKELTLGHPIIMGRKTCESIIAMLGKPLPGRHTIVVSRNPDLSIPGVTMAGSLEAAFAIAERDNPTEIHIGGGAEIYSIALPYTDRLHLTLVESEAEGDTFFPDYSHSFAITKEYEPREYNGLRYEWLDLERSTPRP